MTEKHYENFPVASILLPARLRPAVMAIYNFARSADDIADEGDATPEQRLNDLQSYEDELDRIEANHPVKGQLFEKLIPVIDSYQLPLTPFRALLSAFKQDVVKTRYQNFAELCDYCNRSADPVGTIMLYLYRAASPENLGLSDKICTALQLINFWQDVAIDMGKARIYIPQEDLIRFNITEQQIKDQITDANWQAMMRFQTQRARTMMLEGSPLCKKIPGRIGWELRLVVQGGLRILQAIDGVNGDVFQRRPKLKIFDSIPIFWRAIWM